MLLVVVFLAWAGYSLLFTSGKPYVIQPGPPVTSPVSTPPTSGPGTTVGSTTPATTAPVSLVTVQYSQGAGSTKVPLAAVSRAKQAAVAEVTGVWTGLPLAAGSGPPVPPASPYAGATPTNITWVSGSGSSYVFLVTTPVSATASGDIRVAVSEQRGDWVFAPALSQ